jgi:hypothetical protein
MADWVVRAVLSIVAVVKFLPFVGVLGSNRLELLYGLQIEDPNLLLLLRHRAVLFGLLGAFLLTSALGDPSKWHGPALLASWISVVSFLVLGNDANQLNASVNRVWWIDACMVPLLLIATILHQRSTPNKNKKP